MATLEQITKVRIYCYNPPEELLPDLVIATNIDKWEAIYPNPNQEGIVLYNATIDCLYYLVFTDPNSAAGSSGSKRTEKVGQVSVSVEFTGEYISRWQKILDGYLNGDITIPGYSKIGRNVIIGGVERDEIERVNRNPNSVNGLGCFGVDRCKPRRRVVDPYNPYWRRR